MRFVYMILSSKYNSEVDFASIKDGKAAIVGVKDIDDAINTAKRLLDLGYDAFELCGGFKEEGAGKVAKALDYKVPIGYAIHHPDTEEAYRLAREKEKKQ